MDEEEEEMGSDLEGMAPIPKRRRLANASALMASLQSGLYPEFLGVHGPSQDLNPNDSHYCQIIKKKPQHYNYTPHSDVLCVMYDCAGHPALRNFIIIDILLLNYNSFH